LRLFCHTGATRCTDGVKFGMDEGTEGPLLRATFHPHRCNYKGIGPPKLKFLLRFDQNVEYKRTAGAYSLCIFHNLRSLYPVSGCRRVQSSLTSLIISTSTACSTIVAHNRWSTHMSSCCSGTQCHLTSNHPHLCSSFVNI